MKCDEQVSFHKATQSKLDTFLQFTSLHNFSEFLEEKKSFLFVCLFTIKGFNFPELF